MKNEQRGPWYLLTGLVIGVVFGLIYAWRISPVKYVDTSPATLRDDFKNQYRVLIAAAFVMDGDLPRAQARLNLLNDPDIASAVALQAQRALAEGRPPEESHELGLLAIALSQGVVVTEQPGLSTPSKPSPASALTVTPTFPPVPGSSSPTVPGTTPVPPVSPTAPMTPYPTFTLMPSRTPTPSAGAPFVLKKTPTLVCEPTSKQPLIMVEAWDAAGQPVPGVEVIVNWTGGEDHFFTGLKPKYGLGYGDFLMTPSVTYSLHLAEGGEPVSGLIAADCETASGDRYLGSWKLVFVQP
jgi:hypothetical protein